MVFRAFHGNFAAYGSGTRVIPCDWRASAAALEADYEPPAEPLFMMPARLHDPEEGLAKTGRLSFAFNQSTGESATLYEAPK